MLARWISALDTVILYTAPVAAPGHVQEGPSLAAPIGQLVGRSACWIEFWPTTGDRPCQRQLRLVPCFEFCGQLFDDGCEHPRLTYVSKRSTPEFTHSAGRS